MNTNRTGDISEMVIMQKFIRIGANISIPFNDCPYDLIVDLNGTLYKVQIKSLWNQKDGILRLNTTQGHKSSGLRSYKNNVDLIAAYCNETEHCILIPIKDVIEPKMRFRYKKAKNNQLSNLSEDINKYLFDDNIQDICRVERELTVGAQPLGSN
jgi:hypothetical protein